MDRRLRFSNPHLEKVVTYSVGYKGACLKVAWGLQPPPGDQRLSPCRIRHLSCLFLDDTTGGQAFAKDIVVDERNTFDGRPVVSLTSSLSRNSVTAASPGC